MVSWITLWRELAEAFSHKPSSLGYDDNGNFEHNGVENGYLYMVNEKIEIGIDIFLHPSSTMDENAEFITKRPLNLKLIDNAMAEDIGISF